MAFINKKWRRDIGDNAVEALMRVGGCGVSAVILNKVTSESFTAQSSLYKTIGNLAGPALSVIGLLGDMFLENPMLRSLCQGMYTFAIPKSVAVVAPVVGDYMGLSGIDATNTPPIMNGTPTYPAIMNGIGSTPNFTDYAAQAAPATDGDVRGLAEAMIMN